MTTKTQSAAPPSRLARLGLGLGLKASTSRRGGDFDNDQDYIPYNGPYAAPPTKPRQRDSWGDPLPGVEHDEGALSDRDFYEKYAGDDRTDTHGAGYSGRDLLNDRKSPDARDRAMSGMTVSSGILDPSRKSLATSSARSPRPPGARALRNPVSSFINVDATGGVGESPKPVRISGTPTSPTVYSTDTGSPTTNRGSLASFFTFGQGPKRVPTTSSGSQSTRVQGELRHVASTEWTFPTRKEKGRRARANTVSSTNEDEYHDSYYGTLLPDTADRSRARPHIDTNISSDRPAQEGHAIPLARFPSSSKPQSPPHPYAYPSPSPAFIAAVPRSAPPVGPSTVPYAPPATTPKTKDYAAERDTTLPSLRLTAPRTPQVDKNNVPAYLKPSPRGSLLQGSVSTPNLRALARGQEESGRGGSPLPLRLKGIDRWLSPETWCDALLFPRPRFKMNKAQSEGDGTDTAKLWGRRIVSPPGSPVWPAPPPDPNTTRPMYDDKFMFATVSGQKEVRSLHKSRSAADLLASAEKWTTAAPRAVQREPEEVQRPTSRGTSHRSRPSKTEEEDKGEGPSAPSASTHNASTHTKDKGKLKPPRPKSFAQDDLSLPSPVPSLTKVLEDGRLLEQERLAWQSQATRSFQNKRTRTLSRTRAKSLTATHPRVRRKGSDGKMLDILAERTFLGTQGTTPTVHSQVLFTNQVTPGNGTVSSHSRSTSRPDNTHSRTHSQTTQSQRRSHSRNESWGKTAMKAAKTTASAFCGINEQLSSPEDEQSQGLQNALRTEGSRIIRFGDEGQTEERRPGRGEPVVVISPAIPDQSFAPASASAALAMMSNSGRQGDLSPTPSGQSVSVEGVGIAISSPPPSDEHGHIRFPGHPYAMFSHPHGASVMPEPVQNAPSRSEYAGPHLSSPHIAIASLNVDPNDVACRHRLPPHATLHPYAQGSQSYTTLFPLEDGTYSRHAREDSEGSAVNRMYAQVPSSGQVREILPEEIRYSPAASIEASIADGGLRHAYAQAPRSRGNSDALGMGEVLSYALRRMGSQDSGLGTSEGHGFGRARDWDEERMEIVRNHGEIVDSTHNKASPPRVRQKVSRFEASLRPPFAEKHTFSSEPLSNHTLASSPLEGSDAPPVSEHPIPRSSSPDYPSQASSPQRSPPPLGSSDDLERFRDLFYRPSPKDTSTSTSSEKVRQAASREPSGSHVPDFNVSPSNRTGSGLTTLARQLSDELEALQDERYRLDDLDAIPVWGSRFGGLRGKRPSDATFEQSEQSEQSGSLPHSPRMTTLPLRLPSEKGNMSTLEPALNVPEDIESSRASSIMERSSLDGNEIEFLRLGAVEAVSTPPAVTGDRRVSARLSFVDSDPSVERGERFRSQEVDPSRRIVSQSSLAPPRSFDGTRSSYMTSTTSTSRMSGLSDFPVPPVQVPTPGHTSIIHSYFSDTPQQQLEDPFSIAPAPRPRPRPQPVRLTTFGGEVDISTVQSPQP